MKMLPFLIIFLLLLSPVSSAPTYKFKVDGKELPKGWGCNTWRGRPVDEVEFKGTMVGHLEVGFHRSPLDFKKGPKFRKSEVRPFKAFRTKGQFVHNPNIREIAAEVPLVDRKKMINGKKVRQYYAVRISFQYDGTSKDTGYGDSAEDTLQKLLSHIRVLKPKKKALVEPHTPVSDSLLARDLP